MVRDARLRLQRQFLHADADERRGQPGDDHPVCARLPGHLRRPGIAVLMADGIDKAVATGYTLVLHVALWLPITVLGAYYMAREGIKWSDLLRTEAKEPEVPREPTGQA